MALAATGAQRTLAALKRPGTAMLPKQLNRRLRQATSTRERLLLHAEHSGSFDAIKLSTCWSGLGKSYVNERVARLRPDEWDRQLGPLRQQTLDTLPE